MTHDRLPAGGANRAVIAWSMSAQPAAWSSTIVSITSNSAGGASRIKRPVSG